MIKEAMIKGAMLKEAMFKILICTFLFLGLNPAFSKEIPADALKKTPNISQDNNQPVNKGLISLDEFLSNHALVMPDVKNFRVKVAFREGDTEEKMWVMPFIPKNNGFEGVLVNKPYVIKSLKYGDAVNFTKNEIITWRYDDKPSSDVFAKAKAGDVKAQYAVGLYYQFDVNKESKNKAFKWYLKAAEQGDYRAQNNVSTFYMNGIGIKKNFKQGVKWLNKAAEQGDALAQANLGQIYYVGMGHIKEDKVKALKLFEQGAKQLNAIAQYFLGRMYALGEGGLKQNLKKGKELLILSALQYNKEAIAILKEIGVNVNLGFRDPEKERD